MSDDPYFRLFQLLVRGLEAMRLTREFVGEDTLPALSGWSWYDWIVAVRGFLETRKCEFGCGPGDDAYVRPGFGIVTACPVHSPLIAVYEMVGTGG